MLSQGTGEMRLELERFGVMEQARAGEWAGIRLRFLDTASKQRDVIVQITSLDADGDRPCAVRQFTANPGTWQGAWLYLRLPPAVDPSRDLSANVYEAVQDESTASRNSATPGSRPGRLLIHIPLVPNNRKSLVDPWVGMMAVMGQARFGLDRYTRYAGSNDNYSPTGHERNELVNGMTIPELPDRWMGLAQFSTLIWGSGEPGELRGDRARAIREWVERGGHFIIILPSVGETWSDAKTNELHDLLPNVTINRREGLDLEPYRRLFTLDPLSPLPANAVVYDFVPAADAAPGDARRILNGPDGKCVVVQRIVGGGAVTLVGLDLNRPQFVSGKSLDAEIFWHRVLGRRGRLLASQEQVPIGGPLSSRNPVNYDQDLGPEISKSGQSAAGLLLGFVIFGLYWLLAGPLGFFVLKNRGLSRHAWIGFLGAGAVFTAIAWGGATLIRPSKIEARHVTFIDHVYGQATNRTRTWAGVLIPKYGTHDLAVGDVDETKGDPLGRRTGNVISPWESSADRSSYKSFPDSREYAIDSRGPDILRIPTRATVKEIQADWSGGPRWKMLRPVGDDGTSIGTLSINPKWDASQAQNIPLVLGSLVHDLPGDLTDIWIIVVRGQLDLSAPGPKRTPPEFTSFASAYTHTLWKPGEVLGLEVLTQKAAGATNLVPYLSGLVPLLDQNQQFNVGKLDRDANKAMSRYMGLALFEHLAPPDPTANTSRQIVARRSSTHNWDLSRWLTQPCIIVIASLGDPDHPTPSPTPLLLDGELVPTKGRTIVRWIYPLPDNPPAYSTSADDTSTTVPSPAPTPASPEGG